MRTPPFVSMPQRNYSAHISMLSMLPIFAVCVNIFGY